MTNTVQKIAFFMAGLTLSWAGVASASARAATVSYDLEVFIDSGPLASEIFSGSFSFDDVSLTGSGSESASVSDLEFQFLETFYTEADDPNAEVEFVDEEFLGLSFSPNASLSFIPGFFTVNEAFFAYDTAQGAGAGDITYSLQQEPSPPQPTSVPEPHSVAGIFALGLSGVIGLLKRKHKYFQRY